MVVSQEREVIMSDTETHSTIKPLVMAFLQELMTRYWGPLYHYVKENPELITTMSGFLLNHEKIIVYVGRTHIAVEYIGPELVTELKAEGRAEIQYHDYSTEECNLFEKIIGFEYDSNLDVAMPLASFNEDLLFPTNRGWDKLMELGWNFAAQNSFMGMNVPSPEPMKGQFTRIVNGMFFDADETGLKTRRIKWLDFFPITFDSSDAETDRIGFNLKKWKTWLSQMHTILSLCQMIISLYNYQKLINSSKSGETKIALNQTLLLIYPNQKMNLF